MGGRGVQFRSILLGMCIHSLSVILFGMYLYIFKLGMKLFIRVNKASLLFEIYLYLIIVPIGFHINFNVLFKWI